MDGLDRLVSKIAEQHHGVFGAQHLRELGVKPHERHYRLRIGRWISVHEGAYRVAGTPLTWRGQVLAACWAGGLRAVASHRSAAELWELPGRDGRAVELTCPRRRRARHDGLIVHESRVLDDVVDFTRLDGIPVTTAARTIFDLASFRSSSTVDLAIDRALRRGLVSFDELQVTLARLTRRGRAGVAVFRELLDERSPLAETESEGEHRLLRLFVRLGLPRPVTQHEIRDEDGRLVARVDFAYPDLKIAIEYDSYAHHVGKAALVRDGARRNAIVSLGWLPITATAADLRNGGHRLALDVRRARALRSDGGARE
jgi:hypothetical protein